MRETASICRYSTAVVSSLMKWPSEVFSRWNGHGTKAVNPPVQVVHALLEGFAATEHHGGRRAHAKLVGGAALRHRQRIFLQVPAGERLGGLLNRGRKSLSEPILQNPDTTDGALLAVVYKL